MSKQPPISTWPLQDRPMERLASKGAFALSDTELLAILIGTGSGKGTALDVAREVLSLAKNKIQNLSTLSIRQLCDLHGVGQTKAIRLLAAFELGRRHAIPLDEFSKSISNSQMAADMVIPFMRDLPHEECWVLFLNQANCVTAKEKISSGGVSGTVIDIRMVLKSAIDKLSSAIILVHNHPSGQIKPGAQDREQTQLLQQAAALFNIRLLDHLIIAGNRYYSFTESGDI